MLAVPESLCNPFYIVQTERNQLVEFCARLFIDMPVSIRSDIPVVGGIGHFPYSETVYYDKKDSHGSPPPVL